MGIWGKEEDTSSSHGNLGKEGQKIEKDKQSTEASSSLGVKHADGQNQICSSEVRTCLAQ
jgi:hypothetical protein